MGKIGNFFERLSARIWLTQLLFNLPIITFFYLILVSLSSNYVAQEFQNTVRTKSRLITELITVKHTSEEAYMLLEDLLLSGEILYVALERPGIKPIIVTEGLPEDFSFSESLSIDDKNDSYYGIKIPFSSAALGKNIDLKIVFDESPVHLQIKTIYLWGFYTALAYIILYMPLSLLASIILTKPLRHLGMVARQISSHQRNMPLRSPSKIRELYELYIDLEAMRNELTMQAKEATTREARQRAILENAGEAIFTLDENACMTSLNYAATSILGCVEHEVLGEPFSRFLTTEAETQLLDQLGRPLQQKSTTVEALKENGDSIHVIVSISKIDHEDEITYTVIMLDISERIQLEQKLSQLAYYDSLTGLPNRRLFIDRLGQSLLAAERRETLLGLLFLDLDKFKVVNDTMGHLIGDVLLKQVTERLIKIIRTQDTLARLGGDEFTIILNDIYHVDQIELVTRKIIDSFSEPFMLGEKSMHISTSIGITVYPIDDGNIEDLIKNADTAMYEAKACGRNTFSFYTASLRKKMQEQLFIENALRAAMDNNEITLAYQPQVSMHYQPQIDRYNGKIVGAEALVRWKHPTQGMIFPNDFIPVAEECGLIIQLGKYIIYSVFQQYAMWRDDGLLPPRLAINLSPLQLKDDTIVSYVSDLLKQFSIPPDKIEFEITENCIMDDSENNMDTLDKLRQLGVRLAIDDFGTGHSTLARLNEIKVDILKLDISFVRNINRIESKASITTSIIEMAHKLNIEVVAEGVEMENEMIYLLNKGCDLMQGYYFERPISADEFKKLLINDIAAKAALRNEGRS